MRIWKFQSTLPHGERQELFLLRSVTSCFNPRSHTGSDLSLYFIRTLSQRFNPRSHTGSDPNNVSQMRVDDYVSIHAPTRGATLQAANRQDSKRVSIHAPTRGATQIGYVFARALLSFNPRSHTGSDFFSSSSRQGSTSFNPRSHTGSDQKTTIGNVNQNVSIHAPTRGATA